jgi:hypothetical protein
MRSSSTVSGTANTDTMLLREPPDQWVSFERSSAVYIFMLVLLVQPHPIAAGTIFTLQVKGVEENSEVTSVSDLFVEFLDSTSLVRMQSIRRSVIGHVGHF